MKVSRHQDDEVSKMQDPEILLMLTSKSFVFPFSFLLKKQTYNHVLIAVYYASYCFIFMTCGCLTDVKVILWIKCSEIKDHYKSCCRFLGCFYCNWRWHKDHFSKDKSASSATRQACYTYCCGSTCWKVWVWVQKEYHGKTHCISYPLTFFFFFFASLHGTVST